MNAALLYLAATLLKRRFLFLLRGLRSPMRFLSWMFAGTALGLLFYYRNHAFVGEFVKNTPLVFFLSLLMIVSLIRALFQRGLVFDEPGIEFLLTGPFTQKHLILYRLIPSYLGSISTAVVCPILFGRHFQHPISTGVAIALFQLVCAHFSMAVSIFSGGLSERVFSRLRLVTGVVVVAYCVLWIQRGLHDSATPDRAGDSLANRGAVLRKLLFYPTVAASKGSRGAEILPGVQYIAERLITASSSELALGFSILLLIPLCGISLNRLGRMQTGLFEPVLIANDRRSLIRHQNQYAGGKGLRKGTVLSAAMPSLGIFQGTCGALIWKNLLCARRSRGRLLYALACTLLVTASSLTVVLALRNMSDGENLFELNMVVPSMIAFLAFLLQTAFPFDLRLDASHLSALKTLPITPRRLAFGLIAVPTILSMLFQGISLLTLSIFTPFPGSILLAMIFGFPALILTIQFTWNINYLLTIVTGSSQLAVRKANAISVFVVLTALAALFWPAGYAQLELIRRNLDGLGLATGVGIQYLVVLGLLALFANLIGKPEAKTETYP
jgi:hypothetical protein